MFRITKLGPASERSSQIAEGHSLRGKLETILGRLLTKRNYYYNLDQVYLELYVSKIQTWKYRAKINRRSVERVQRDKAINQQKWVNDELTNEAFDVEREKLNQTLGRYQHERDVIAVALAKSEKVLAEYKKIRKAESKYVWIWENLLTIHL